MRVVGYINGPNYHSFMADLDFSFDFPIILAKISNLPLLASIKMRNPFGRVAQWLA
jgi:hypothetical protein